MDDPDVDATVDGVDAPADDEAFAALSDSTRLAILGALWTADDEVVSFSDLRERVGMRDSGQFNYHLGELVGRYVAKSEDGYRLRLSGMKVVGSLLAGEFTVEDGIDPLSLDEPCPACGGDRTFRYDGEWATVDCEDCEVFSRFGIPPGVFEGYEREQFPDVAMRYARVLFRGTTDGFCPFCEGPMEPTVRPVADESDDVPERFTTVPTAEYDCDRCGETVTLDVRVGLSDHPAVVAFYHDHGVDVRERALWEFGGLDPDYTTITGRDPLRAQVRYEAGDEELVLTVDEEMAVRDVERS